MTDEIIKRDRRPLEKEELEGWKDMYYSSSTIEEIAKKFNRKKTFVYDNFRNYGILGISPQQRKREDEYKEQISKYWENLGYIIEVGEDHNGYARSDLINGMPTQMGKVWKDGPR